MAQAINLVRDKSINFEYKGSKVRFGRLRWNPYTYCWLTDFRCDDTYVHGLTLRCGVNLLRQFNVPMNLYIINAEDIYTDPVNFGSIRMYILENTDLENLTIGVPTYV